LPRANALRRKEIDSTHVAEVQGVFIILGRWLDGKTHKLRKKGL
jgi:hypothetical protein